MTLTVTFKKLANDDDKLLIGENKENQDIEDNSNNDTSKKRHRFKNYVIGVLVSICLILAGLLCWNAYLTYYHTQIHETADAINENNATSPVTRKEFEKMYSVLKNYATMQDNDTDEDILHLGKKLQEVEEILNKTNAHVQHSFSVGFQAFLYSDGNRQNCDKVQFDDNVNLNLGNGYSTSGVFTVPPGKGGLYYFNTFLQFNDYESGEFELVVGGATRCWIRGDDNGAGNDFDNGSCESLQHLKPGDTAYVRRFYTEYSVKYAVFAGFLMKADA